jgi:hypothetical protein
MRTSVAIAAVLASVGLPIRAANKQASSTPCKLTPSVTVSSPTILPGEPLDLAFRLTNTSGTDVSIEMPSETIGSVRVVIAGTGEPPVFKRYLGPGWGTEDAVQTPKPLAKDASINLNLRVLYQVQREQPYTFATAGMFRLKVLYQDGSVCPAGTETPVFTIQVMEPKGADLAAWNAIKDCGRCAHFLHRGTASRNPASQDAVALLRDLSRHYPKSRYTSTIRARLDALDEQEKKKKAKDKDKPHDDQ